MSLGALEIMSARAGVYILNDTSTYTGNVAAVVVLEDTIFNLLGDAKGNDKDDYIADSATAVKAEAIITPIDVNRPFNSIDLTSGSVALVRQ